MTKSQSKELALSTPAANPISAWLAGGTFDQLTQLATKFAQSQLVPQHFRGKPHDCFIAMQLAHRMQVDPFLVLQNLNVLHGKPSWSATFTIALMNERGPFAEKVRFKSEGTGRSLKVTAMAKLKETGEVAEAFASMDMAEKEGWTKNTKYQTMPEQMLTYRAGTFLARKYCPEILMGMQTVDEIEDVAAARAREVNGAVDAEAVEVPSTAEKVQNINEQIQNSI